MQMCLWVPHTTGHQSHLCSDHINCKQVVKSATPCRYQKGTPLAVQMPLMMPHRNNNWPKFSFRSLPLMQDLLTGANRHPAAERSSSSPLSTRKGISMEMELAKPPPLQSEQLLSTINHSIKWSIHHPPGKNRLLENIPHYNSYLALYCNTSGNSVWG